VHATAVTCKHARWSAQCAYNGQLLQLLRAFPSGSIVTFVFVCYNCVKRWPIFRILIPTHKYAAKKDPATSQTLSYENIIMRFEYRRLQSSVATCLRCGGIFSNCCIAYLLLSVSVKELFYHLYSP